MHVRHADPQRRTIVGHLLCSLLERACEDQRVSRGLAGRRYAVSVVVSGIETSIEFAGEDVILHPERLGSVKATLESDMRTLLALTGGESMVGAWLGGDLRVRGNPLRLLPLLPLMKPVPR